jgi:hypothetical protein
MNSLPAFQHMWNVLDSTGPHFMTLNFNEYVKNHKTLNRTDEDFAYLVQSMGIFSTMGQLDVDFPCPYLHILLQIHTE